MKFWINSFILSSSRWTALSKMNVARCDFACAEVDGVIYVAGGFGPSGDSLSSVEVYDPEQNKWMLRPLAYAANVVVWVC
jgi:N-acetylneuraminic acid mutarotase